MEHTTSFSAIVVTYNESRHLRECLDSLAFCLERLVFDLGSTDSSREIAEACGATVRIVERKPVVEQVWIDAVNYTQNEWVVFLDPDEIFPGGDIEQQLLTTISNNPDAGIICLPWHFYFKGEPISSTRWGLKPNYKWFVRHKNRVIHQGDVHNGVQLRAGFHTINMKPLDGLYVKHYWSDSYRQLFTKHLRYVKQEGTTRHGRGEVFWPGRLFQETADALQQNLFEYGGIKGGAVGIFLSFFYAWYVAMSLVSLWYFQRRLTKRSA